MSIWVAPLAALGIIAAFLTIGAVAIYCVDQMLNQDAKYRCPTCGRATHNDYGEADAGKTGRAEKRWAP